MGGPEFIFGLGINRSGMPPEVSGNSALAYYEFKRKRRNINSTNTGLTILGWLWIKDREMAMDFNSDLLLLSV